MYRLCIFILLFFGLEILQVSAQYVPENNTSKDTTIKVSPADDSKDPPISSTPNGSFDKSRLVPGGNFALNFGNPFYLDLSPTLGYMVTDKFLLGLGATYMSFRSNGYGFNFYGGRILGRFKIMDNIFANAELDFLNVPDDLQGYGIAGARRWLVSPLLGASYIVPFGKRGCVQATLYYNLNYQQKYSPYNSPVVWRLGFFL